MRRRILVNNGGLDDKPIIDSLPADICISDTTDGDKLKILDGETWTSEKYPIDVYIPIGVVVVPASHNHYADGKCAIMSLNEMSCNTPQTGANSAQGMYWGVYDSDISSLPNLIYVPYVGNGSKINPNVIGQDYSNYLPSDQTSYSIENPYDTKTKYYFGESYYYYAPSPYNNDGTFNSNYSLTTSPSSTANCLADFDGYGNTKKILEIRGSKDYSSWLPMYNNQSDYPAASCCDMYSTYGTNQGEWYLPSCGELGYVCVRAQAINNTISKLISAGVTNACAVLLDTYWSSTEQNSYMARYIVFLTGTIDAMLNKTRNFYTRSFRLV